VNPVAPTSTPASSIALVLLGSLIGSYGMVCLKKASKDLHLGILKIINPQLVLGVTLFMISSVFYVIGIRHGQISVLYPTVSLSYVWALFWAKIAFGEAFTKQKFTGLGLVLLGVVLVQLGS
jgi:drug/metabolite transporter (DMT)-like permease